VIPKSFKLMGYTIKVTVCELPKRKYGDWSLSNQEIRIAPLGPKMSAEMQLQTFWHEVVHACLDVMSYEEQSKDEAFVDRLGQCLAQIQQTRKP
jgi:hypothetical protein